MPTKSSLLWFIWLSCAKAKQCPKSCTQIMGASVENDGTVWPIKLDKLYSIYMYMLDLSICLLWVCVCVCVRGLVWAHFKVHLAWRWHAMHHALYTHEWTVRILLGAPIQGDSSHLTHAGQRNGATFSVWVLQNAKYASSFVWRVFKRVLRTVARPVQGMRCQAPCFQNRSKQIFYTRV